MNETSQIIRRKDLAELSSDFRQALSPFNALVDQLRRQISLNAETNEKLTHFRYMLSVLIVLVVMVSVLAICLIAFAVHVEQRVLPSHSALQHIGAIVCE